MRKFLLLSLFASFSITLANAQEICNDGIDNDGDGFTDCFDSDCSDNSACDGFYLGNDASCQAEPSEFPQFTLSLGYQSNNDASLNLSRIAIGDLDRDGIPEILSTNQGDDRIYILNGDDATIKHQATTNNPSFRSAAIANLQDDNCGEVFIINENNGSDYRIRSFDCELNELWVSERFNQDPVFVSFADFDRDGQAEMYYKDEIRDPVTGTRIVASTTGNWNNIPSGGVAVDIVGDADLELVLGNRIYAVELNGRTQDVGTLTLLATMPTAYQTKNNSFASAQSSTTSIADYNLDGNLDVIITGANGGNVSSVFFWDVINNTAKVFNDPIGTGTYQFGWQRGMGRVNIADLDGDGQLNAAFVSGQFLYALDENWEPLWVDAFGDPAPTVVNEETSGITGCTLFDFNGDGQSEVVYRDEDYLYIINGNDGSVNTQIHCRSRTSVEYPIVADVDADGSTEICVVCTTETHNAATPGRNLGINDPAEVRIYKSGGEPWVPARRVWNQHAYFNVNINDDLTVPQNQQKHQLVFSNGTCAAGAVRPLNSFLNQSPFLSSDGCPTYASPDLNILESTLSVTPPNCPDEQFTVSFDFENIGDVPLSGDVPITFYDGDPLIAGTNKLNTVFITLNNFAVGNVGSAVDLLIDGTGGPFTLYASLNDNGSTTPTPISFPASNFLECSYANNIVSAAVNPIPFTLSTETTNNIVCASGGVPPNGSARVFRLVGGTEVTSDYDFFWFNGTTVDGTPDYTGAIYTDLSAGTYTVFASDKIAGCSSDTVQVVISESARDVTANITVDRGNDNCRNPNGQLTVSINGGEPVGNFDYEWYEGNTVGGGLQISNSHVANNLESATYTVLITEKATGCQTIESAQVPDETVTPVVTATATDIACSDTDTGVISANVGGSTTGYTFEWYIGTSEKPTADFTSSTVNNLPQGSYTVKVTDNITNCESALVTVVIDQTLSPEIDSITSTENNSCDPNDPNGTVTVSIVGNPSEHTIEWFAGASATGTAIGSGLSLEGLGGGEYTVKVTNNDTGCFTTDRVTINNNIVIPNLSATTSPVTTCNPFNGRVEASVDLDNVSDYTFFWYEGDQVDNSLEIEGESSNVLDNQEPGFYTVQALNNNRNCLADPITVEVIDQAIIAITQNDNVLALPSDCSTDNGVLEVEASSPNNTSGFLYEWYAGNTTIGTPFLSETVISGPSRASNLFSGLYTVVATDLDNGCSNSRIFNLPFVDAPNLETITVTNTTTCDPNDEGSITVELTPTTAAIDAFDYTINLYEEDDITNTIDSQPGVTGVATYTFTGLSEGNYTVEALSTPALGSCSVYSFAEIELDATDPIVNIISRVPNTHCTNSLANGSLEVSIDNGASPSLYRINWYEGTDTSTPLGTNVGTAAGVNGEIANGVFGGSYTVEVFNEATECSTIRTFSIVDNPIIVSIPSSELDISPITRCDFNDSEVTVNNVYENGIVADKNDYIFEWYDADGNQLPNESSPNNTDTIASIPEGSYFVKAISNVSGCETSLTEFSIENEIVIPTITVDFEHPQRCVTPGLGELRVTASAPATSFSYNWYNGEIASGPVVQTGPDYVDLPEGFYTVEITDSVSNCIYTETYELVTELNSVNISTSATAVTNCDAPNGSVFATVTSIGGYTYNWTDASGNSIGNTKEINGLPAGEYTIVVTDTTDTFCENTATLVVPNDQIIPALVLEQTAPLTVCDVTIANGAAKASVDGGFIGYTFEWFEGNSASGTVIHIGPEYSEMEDRTYTVLATNNLTQCSNEVSITISSDIPTVEDPSIEILANDTHCQIDNGAMRVDVGGNTGNYTFDWYRGENSSGTGFATGDRITDLAAGTYTVVATDIRTGCISAAVSAEIIEELSFPELNIETREANCNQDNGEATVFISGGVEVERIEWYNSFGSLITTGPNLSGVPAGDYRVRVSTAKGCSVEEDIQILSEISAFNGISRNGDGANSFFKIDCITLYPDNVVKIYNRAGTLVYQGNGYDNNNIKFDGVSNRGINILGENLPDGTYFYVIDKKDGSKIVNGYLEIVN
ncbi:gliding motility-associated C-terminal domain-containing protein [Marivirga sericea]|uniref:Gliding motility-associated C-terminal domain-containing protein n=1 Tax=Marivirga sericea TaxID=1028 RepID=A0A1X7JMJ1_9BACT|nr:gliding motility-associated C-terminal domain-containing protein [Marivirga sericea]SMG29143.1 gliding motility-associated C-terminal domain-containing protein [Marivirga sericea]